MTDRDELVVQRGHVASAVLCNRSYPNSFPISEKQHTEVALPVEPVHLMQRDDLGQTRTSPDVDTSRGHRYPGDRPGHATNEGKDQLSKFRDPLQGVDLSQDTGRSRAKRSDRRLGAAFRTSGGCNRYSDALLFWTCRVDQRSPRWASR